MSVQVQKYCLNRLLFLKLKDPYVGYVFQHFGGSFVAQLSAVVGHCIYICY